MKITLEEVLPIKPNILRIKAYTISDPEADEPILVNYELAIHVQDFMTLRDDNIAEIDVDKLKHLLSQQVADLQNTANVGRAIELANLQWDIVLEQQEETLKDGKHLAYGEKD